MNGAYADDFDRGRFCRALRPEPFGSNQEAGCKGVGLMTHQFHPDAHRGGIVLPNLGSLTPRRALRGTRQRRRQDPSSWRCARGMVAASEASLSRLVLRWSGSRRCEFAEMPTANSATAPFPPNPLQKRADSLDHMKIQRVIAKSAELMGSEGVNDSVVGRFIEATAHENPLCISAVRVSVNPVRLGYSQNCYFVFI